MIKLSKESLETFKHDKNVVTEEKKTFQVDVDITMSKVFFIDAGSEEEARSIVNERMQREPYYWADGSIYAKHEITDVNETED